LRDSEKSRRRLFDRLDLITDIAVSATKEKNNTVVFRSLLTLRSVLETYIADKGGLTATWYPVHRIGTFELKNDNFVESKLVASLRRILEVCIAEEYHDATAEVSTHLAATGVMFLERGMNDPLESVLVAFQRAYYLMTKSSRDQAAAGIILQQYPRILHRAAKLDPVQLRDSAFVEKRVLGLARLIGSVSRLALFQIEEDHLDGLREILSEFFAPSLDILGGLRPTDWTDFEQAEWQHGKVQEIQKQVNDLVLSWLVSLGVLAVAGKKVRSLGLILGPGGPTALRQLFQGKELEVRWALHAYEPAMTLRLPPWGEVSEGDIAKFYVIARTNFGAPEILGDFTTIRFISRNKGQIVAALGELENEFSTWAPVLGTRSEAELAEIGKLLAMRVSSWEKELPIILKQASLSPRLLAEGQAAFEESFLSSRWGADALPIKSVSGAAGQDLTISLRLLLPRDCFVEGIASCDPAIRELARLAASDEAEKFISSLRAQIQLAALEPDRPVYRILTMVVESLAARGYSPDTLILDLETDDYLWIDPDVRQAYKRVSPPKGRTFHGVLRILDFDLTVYSARKLLEETIVVADSKRLGWLESSTGETLDVRIRAPESGEVTTAQEREGEQYGGWMILEARSQRKLVLSDPQASVAATVPSRKR